MFKIKDAVDQLHASRSTDDTYLYNLDIQWQRTQVHVRAEHSFWTTY